MLYEFFVMIKCNHGDVVQRVKDRGQKSGVRCQSAVSGDVRAEHADILNNVKISSNLQTFDMSDIKSLESSTQLSFWKHLVISFLKIFMTYSGQALFAERSLPADPR